MKSAETKVHLYRDQFIEKERGFIKIGGISISGFQYSSGVRALRIKNMRGEVIMLPFHGQKVWDAVFDGRRIKMRTVVREPKNTQDFLSNMGGFLFHCGMSAIGSPGQGDTHSIHGELVNAQYQQAWIETGSDERGGYVEVSGSYEHSAAFGHYYTASPSLRIYENDALIHFTMRVKNLNKTPMEYMYLAHINFLPVDDGHLVYSAKYDAKHVRIRNSFPSHMQPTEKLRDFVNELVKDPTIHHILKQEQTFDPEIVFMIDFEADADGWAHSMQVHPDGSADYVCHKPAQLDHGVRWISRTPNQQALGMEVGTAGVEGYTAEKAKGTVKLLEAGDEFFCEYAAGLLNKEKTLTVQAKINAQNGEIG